MREGLCENDGDDEQGGNHHQFKAQDARQPSSRQGAIPYRLMFREVVFGPLFCGRHL
jgi:hypothetical protein